MKQALKNEQKGMISLEAAIILPLVLILLFFLLSAVRLLREDSLIRYAIDKSCEEMALFLPAAEALASPLAGVASEFDEIITRLLPLPEAKEIIMAMAADIGSSLLLANLTNNRLDFWLDEGRAGLGLDHIQHERQIFFNWQAKDNLIGLHVSYRQNTLLGPIQKSAYGIIPLWLSNGLDLESKEEEQKEAEDEGDIWSLSNFERGQRFRELFGGNLPFSFPVIARWDGRTATSIKSMDLTAPSYSTAYMASRQLERHLLELANFQGAAYKNKGQEYFVLAEDIRTKELILIIPKNYPNWLSLEQRRIWQDLASQLNIRLTIKETGISRRFLESDQNY